MSKPVDAWTTERKKRKPPFGQLSSTEKKTNVLKAFKNPKRGLKDEVSDFFTETSFTALVRIYKATSLVKRLMWTLMVLFMASWLVVQCYWLLDKYFKYPIEVKMDFTSANQLEFPSVTICNLNAILESKLHEPGFEPLAKYSPIKTFDMLFKLAMLKMFAALHNNNCNKSTAFQCDSGYCLPLKYICDGWGDCLDNADEEDCTAWPCPHPNFRCDSGRCIPGHWLCNGYRDCPGDEDEPTSCAYNIQSTTPTPSDTSPAPHGNVSTPIPPSSPLPHHQTASILYTDTRTSTSADNSRRRRDVMNGLEGQEQPLSSTSNIFGNSRTVFEEEDATEDRPIPRLKRRRETNNMADIRLRRESNQPFLRKRRSADSSQKSQREDSADGGKDINRWDGLTISDSSSFYMDRTEEYKATMTYAQITALMNETDLRKSGHALKDFMASCTFGGYQCSPQNFTYFHNYKYGNCFTFNTVGHNVDLYTKFPGPSNGLTLELFLDSDEYVANLSPGKGARLTVHKKGTPPFPEDEGYSVISGLSVNIGMRQVKMSRVSPPYGVCKDVGETKDYYEIYKGFRYTKLSCLKSCYQDIILEHCHCQTPLYFVRPDLPVCDLTNVTVDTCVMTLPTSQSARYNKCDKLCPVPCSETKYETSFSMAQWPSEKNEKFVRERMNKSTGKYKSDKPIKEDFTRVQIYFTDLMYQHMEQQQAYEVRGQGRKVNLLTSMNLISDLGGQLGLWLGLSAITLGELCSFMFSLGRSLPLLCRALKKKIGMTEPSFRQPSTQDGMATQLKLDDMDVFTVNDLSSVMKKTPG